MSRGTSRGTSSPSTPIECGPGVEGSSVDPHPVHWTRGGSKKGARLRDPKKHLSSWISCKGDSLPAHADASAAVEGFPVVLSSYLLEPWLMTPLPMHSLAPIFSPSAHLHGNGAHLFAHRRFVFGICVCNVLHTMPCFSLAVLGCTGQAHKGLHCVPRLALEEPFLMRCKRFGTLREFRILHRLFAVRQE